MPRLPLGQELPWTEQLPGQSWHARRSPHRLSLTVLLYFSAGSKQPLGVSTLWIEMRPIFVPSIPWSHAPGEPWTGYSWRTLPFWIILLAVREAIPMFSPQVEIKEKKTTNIISMFSRWAFTLKWKQLELDHNQPIKRLFFCFLNYKSCIVHVCFALVFKLFDLHTHTHTHTQPQQSLRAKWSLKRSKRRKEI